MSPPCQTTHAWVSIRRRFVRCCVVIKQLTESFQRLDTNRSGWVQMNYGQIDSQYVQRHPSLTALLSRRDVHANHPLIALERSPSAILNDRLLARQPQRFLVIYPIVNQKNVLSTCTVACPSRNTILLTSDQGTSCSQCVTKMTA